MRISFLELGIGFPYSGALGTTYGDAIKQGRSDITVFIPPTQKQLITDFLAERNYTISDEKFDYDEEIKYAN